MADQAARQHRLAQIQKLLDLFQAANGKPATSPEELDNWLASSEGPTVTAPRTDKDGKMKFG